MTQTENAGEESIRNTLAPMLCVAMGRVASEFGCSAPENVVVSDDTCALAHGDSDNSFHGEAEMSTHNHGPTANPSSLMVCLVVLGCGISMWSDPGLPQFNETANAQTSEGRPTVKIDRSKAKSIFANATRVTPAERHAVFDFGLKPLANDDGVKTATTTVRVYLNYYTAKWMQAALAMSMERHVKVFGPLGQDKPVDLKASPEVALRPVYANFVRLTGSPEELIMEMGLNPMPVGVPKAPIPVSFIVIMDFETGNTLLSQVKAVIDQYEKEHGPIETDIQKRIVGGRLAAP